MIKPLYTYMAKVVSVYDGDTVTVDIDLGFGIWMRGQKLRLFGIDTPELRGPERARGIEVRDWLRQRITDGELVVETVRDTKGKYGRWLATIWVDDVNINEELLSKGMAEPYDI